MTRSIDPTLITALQQPSVSLFYAVELNFDSGTHRYWTGVGDKVLGGQTYTGAGTLLGVEGLDESGDLSSKGAKITVAGIDSTIVAIALAEPYQGRQCSIYLGVDGNSNLATVFKGTMDVMSIEDSGETSTIVIGVESRTALLQRTSTFRYTSASQKDRYEGDKFFDWVARLADKNVYWGAVPK